MALDKAALRGDGKFRGSAALPFDPRIDLTLLQRSVRRQPN